MRAFYDAWWAELEPTFARTTELHIGHPDHPLVTLTSHDWIQEAYPPWNQQQNGPKLPVRPNSKGLKHEGHWAIKVLTAGNAKWRSPLAGRIRQSNQRGITCRGSGAWCGQGIPCPARVGNRSSFGNYAFE